MLEDSKNLKDTSSENLSPIKDIAISSKYNKVSKLITALFMVTDIMDREEPLRLKLRSIGADILSDVYANSLRTSFKVNEILSFLDIAFTLGMVSEMNKNILEREFNLLKNSIGYSEPAWLENFIGSDSLGHEESSKQISYKTRIGVQKAGTLMSALSRVNVLNPKIEQKQKLKETQKNENFDLLKRSRREEILTIIKSNQNTLSNGGLTITDIRGGAKVSSNGHLITDSSEKTLQRELVSMVKDNLLKKSGEKRWSRYFL